ncbi:MAG: hypothetical protein D6761_03365 [Candidatus Dadabacteria bacterium]|nr:MAG: hypothetical protein D6761_03365 [Candidatus Dadabacteria bacterium]
MRRAVALLAACACVGCFGAPTTGIDEQIVADRMAELREAGAFVARWTNEAQPAVIIDDPADPAYGTRLTASPETLLPAAPTLLAWVAPRDRADLRPFGVTDVGAFVEAHVENPLSRQEALLAGPAWLTLPFRRGPAFGQLDTRQLNDATVTLVLPGGIDTLTPASVTGTAMTVALSSFGTFAPTLPDEAPQTVSQASALLDSRCLVPAIDADLALTAVVVVATRAEAYDLWIDGLDGHAADGLIDTRIAADRSPAGAIETIRETDGRSALRQVVTFSNDGSGRPRSAQIRDATGANAALLSWQYETSPDRAIIEADFDLDGTAETTTVTWFDALGAVTAVLAATHQTTIARTVPGWPTRVSESANGRPACTAIEFTTSGTAATAFAWASDTNCEARPADAFALPASGCSSEAFDLVWTESTGDRAFGYGLLRPDRRNNGLTE